MKISLLLAGLLLAISAQSQTLTNITLAVISRFSDGTSVTNITQITNTNQFNSIQFAVDKINVERVAAGQPPITTFNQFFTNSIVRTVVAARDDRDRNFPTLLQERVGIMTEADKQTILTIINKY